MADPTDVTLPEVAEQVDNSLPTRLATGGTLIGGDARDRLARHLHLRSIHADWRDHHELLWDRRSERIDFDAVYAEADALLAVITGKDS